MERVGCSSRVWGLRHTHLSSATAATLVGIVAIDLRVVFLAAAIAHCRVVRASIPAMFAVAQASTSNQRMTQDFPSLVKNL